MAGAKQALLDDLRGRIQSVLDRPAPAPAPVIRAAGPSLRVHTHYLEPHHHHGKIPIARALSAEAHLVAELALDPTLERVDLSSALFLDTETTGLSGAGIVPFLIGLGWFEDQSFVVEQLFLEELGEEHPMLLRLEERLSRASCIVTYNGKAFDWPILVNRFAMTRLPAPRALPHVDLLHCARRIHRRRLGAVRLVDVEERVLGMRRERDIDGAEIPGLYWTFLRHKNDAAVAPIIEHNANDLIALAALLAHLSERFARVYVEDDPIDQLARAKLAFRAKDEPRAEQFAEAAGEGGGDPDITVEAYALLALIKKRSADLAGAERALLFALEAAEGDAELAAPIHLELAKLYEHRLKDLARARAHALLTSEPAP
jgi:uncharacterized protein YprB with RNaseH-like and TPR domain